MRKRALFILIILILGIIRYYPTLYYGLARDDFLTVKGVLVECHRLIPFYLLYFLSYLTDKNPFYLHIPNLIFNDLTAIALFFLISIIFKKDLYGFCYAIFFLLLPTLEVQVGWVTALESIMALCLGLYALLFLWLSLKNGLKIWLFLLSALCYTSAFLCKEYVYFLYPFILIIWLYHFKKGNYSLKAIIPIAVMSGILVFFYLWIVPGKPEAFPFATENFFYKQYFLFRYRHFKVYAKVIALTFSTFLSDLGLLELVDPDRKLIYESQFWHLAVISLGLLLLSQKAGWRIRLAVALGVFWTLISHIIIAFSGRGYWWAMGMRYYSKAPGYLFFLLIPILIAFKGEKREKSEVRERNLLYTKLMPTAGTIYFLLIAALLWLNPPAPDELYKRINIYSGIQKKAILKTFGKPNEEINREDEMLWLYPKCLVVLDPKTNRTKEFVREFSVIPIAQKYLSGLSIDQVNILLGKPERIKEMKTPFEGGAKLEKVSYFYNPVLGNLVCLFGEGKLKNIFIDSPYLIKTRILPHLDKRPQFIAQLLFEEPAEERESVLSDGRQAEIWAYKRHNDRLILLFINHQYSARYTFINHFQEFMPFDPLNTFTSELIFFMLGEPEEFERNPEVLKAVYRRGLNSLIFLFENGICQAVAYRNEGKWGLIPDIIQPGISREMLILLFGEPENSEKMLIKAAINGKEVIKERETLYYEDYTAILDDGKFVELFYR